MYLIRHVRPCNGIVLRVPPQLLFLRHMCIFCMAPNVLKGSFDEISRDLGIPESAVRHFLEVSVTPSLASSPKRLECLVDGFGV